jgi:hypothetical protein
MGDKSHWMRTYRASMVNLKCRPSEEGIQFEIEYPAATRRDAIVRAKRNFPGLTLVGIKRVGRYKIEHDGSTGLFATWLSEYGTH